MRTDVKVGLICAFAIVLCVVIYFVARGNSRPNAARAADNTVVRAAEPARPATPAPATTSDPIIPDRSVASAVGGDVLRISPPGMGPQTPAPGTVPLIPQTMPAVTPRPSLEIPSLSLGATLTGATTYKIQKGDMLGAISKKFNVPVKTIEAANPGIDSTRLKIDSIIKIPAASTAVATTRPATTPPATRPAVTPGTTVAVTIKPGTTYKVKKGDTLAAIAKAAYGTTVGWQKIFQANRSSLNDPNIVPVGASIVIPQK